MYIKVQSVGGKRACLIKSCNFEDFRFFSVPCLLRSSLVFDKLFFARMVSFESKNNGHKSMKNFDAIISETQIWGFNRTLEFRAVSVSFRYCTLSRTTNIRCVQDKSAESYCYLTFYSSPSYPFRGKPIAKTNPSNARFSDRLRPLSIPKPSTPFSTTFLH